MKLLHILALSTLLVGLLFYGKALAVEEDWQTNLDEAIKVAKKEKKAVFVDFTGSDWCGWCINLHKHVLVKEEFMTEAKKYFVMCVIDYPQSKPQTDEEKAHAADLKEKYDIQGFPSLYIIDVDGIPIRKLNTSYKEGVEGVLKAMKDGLDEGLASKKVCDEAVTVLSKNEKITAGDKNALSAGKQLLAQVEFPEFYQDAIDSLKPLASDNNANGLKEGFLLLELRNAPFPNARNMQQFKVSVENLAALENLSGDTKKIAAVAQAVLHKSNNETEEALACLAKAEGLENYFGIEVSKIEEWVKQQPQGR